jgi:hypothetical protein
MSKAIKRIIGAAAPLAGFIPGVGPLGAAALGAAAGGLSGGGIKGALTGGLGAALGGGGGKVFGGAVNSGLGLGLNSTANISALGTGLLGAGFGGVKGGIKGALAGGAAGGLGGFAGAGGFEGTAIGDVLGSPAGTALGGGLQGPTQGSGIIGAATGGGGAGGSLAGNGFSNLAKFSPVLNAVGAFNEFGAQDDIEEKLLEQQRRSEEAFAPFTTAEFNPGDLTQDPGFQFRLEQGNQALDRSLGARGNLFSGRAIKAGQEFGQGLADQTFNDAFRRNLQEQNFRFGATKAATGVFDNIGNIGAGAEAGRTNAISRGLSALGGSGARTIIGYRTDGQPIYAEV